jgi:hypothetical protein
MDSLAFVSRLFGVSFALGLDPFAPVLVFGLARRFDLIADPYLQSPAFDQFASTPFLIVIGALYVLHILADKAPFAAHLLDVIYFVAKPLAASFLAFATANALDKASTLHIVTLSVLVVGSIGISTAVHFARSTVRLATTTVSFGFLTPIVSAIENGFAAAFSALAVFQPVVAVVLACLFFVPALVAVRRFMRRRRSIVPA